MYLNYDKNLMKRLYKLLGPILTFLISIIILLDSAFIIINLTQAHCFAMKTLADILSENTRLLYVFTFGISLLHLFAGALIHFYQVFVHVNNRINGIAKKLVLRGLTGTALTLLLYFLHAILSFAVTYYCLELVNNNFSPVGY